jgi:hypothetical protein
MKWTAQSLGQAMIDHFSSWVGTESEELLEDLGTVIDNLSDHLSDLPAMDDPIWGQAFEFFEQEQARMEKALRARFDEVQVWWDNAEPKYACWAASGVRADDDPDSEPRYDHETCEGIGRDDVDAALARVGGAYYPDGWTYDEHPIGGGGCGVKYRVYSLKLRD